MDLESHEKSIIPLQISSAYGPHLNFGDGIWFFFKKQDFSYLVKWSIQINFLRGLLCQSVADNSNKKQATWWSLRPLEN